MIDFILELLGIKPKTIRIGKITISMEDVGYYEKYCVKAKKRLYFMVDLDRKNNLFKLCKNKNPLNIGCSAPSIQMLEKILTSVILLLWREYVKCDPESLTDRGLNLRHELLELFFEEEVQSERGGTWLSHDRDPLMTRDLTQGERERYLPYKEGEPDPRYVWLDGPNMSLALARSLEAERRSLVQK